MSVPTALEFAEAARHLIDEPRLDHAMRRVVDYAVKMTDADHAGLTLRRTDQQLSIVATSSIEVERAYQIQESSREGPSFSVLASEQTCLVRDVATDTRWPRWAAMLAGVGLRATVSARMFTFRRIIGTLDLYGGRAHQLDEDDVQRAQVLASHASIALDFLHEADGLRRAVETRNVIGQAQGLLMERYGLDPRRAFELLRRYSQDTNTKLRDVAVQLVKTGHLPTRAHDHEH